MSLSKHLPVALLMTVVAALNCTAAIPTGYYQSLNGIEQPQQLKTAVYTIVNPHTTPAANGYSAYYTSLSRLFLQTDVYPDGSNRWWDMYSGVPHYAPSFSGLNREHSFPKSWWGGLTNIPPYVDLNHLYPSEAVANQHKSNYPLGVVNMAESVDFNNGYSKIGYAEPGLGGGAKYVFEPADEYKGDFARTYFYMVTCYQNLTWNTNYMFMLQQNTWPTLKPWAYEMLLEWSHNDPVSQKEIDRNEAVYAIQNNRNPFIDLPGLEDYIWGDKQGLTYYLPTSPGQPDGDPQLFSPVDGMALDFGQCAVGNSVVRHLLFLGENLKGNISVVVARDGDTDHRSMFTAENRTISAELVNSSAGYYLALTYKPTSAGTHRANLTVFDVTGWNGGSLNVQLIGEGLQAPSLKQIKALPASDVTSESYVANWEVPAGDVVDYYIVNRTRYIDGSYVVDRLEAESNSLLISDFNPAVYDSYTVQSVRLGYESVPSNAIVVSGAAIEGVDAGQPLAVEIVDRTVRFICAEPQQNVCIYDIAGRLHSVIPEISRNSSLTLPAGVYFVVTDSHTSPVKILIR